MQTSTSLPPNPRLNTHSSKDSEGTKRGRTTSVLSQNDTGSRPQSEDKTDRRKGRGRTVLSAEDEGEDSNSKQEGSRMKSASNARDNDRRDPPTAHGKLNDTSTGRRLEKEDNRASYSSKASNLIISFPRGDPENPYNWSTRRKIFVLFAGIVSVINSTLGSSLPSGAIEYLADYFHVTSQAQLVLPISLFLVGYVFGPIVFAPLTPIISGFVSVITWRWTFWIGLIIAGVSQVFLFFMPETYGPTILKHRARRMRRETGNPNIFAPIELEKKGARQMITITLTRPVRMVFSEAIVLFTCLYLSIAYAIFYLYFEAYPLIFQDLYGFSTGVAGLPFLAISVGAFLSTGIFMYWDTKLARAKKANARWAIIEEYRRLPLACVGGPLYVISLFWLAWTAKLDIHWIVPILSGVPFGIGFMLIFMALLNYITDAYEVFAASGMAATSACRSIFGAVLPIAGRPMYKALGTAWASSLLGFLSLGMCIIPFAFIKYGDRIRANSTFCQELREKKRQDDDERERENNDTAASIEDFDRLNASREESKEGV
ncbi:MAG: hypothetical protein Q9220_000949 [cf. Caloplaca sp. 1 TL-2023]